MEQMKAVIMAGGLGTRLKPMTLTAPKPNLPILNRPCVGHIAELLMRNGITDACVTLRYRGDEIARTLQAIQGFHVTCFYEDMPLGTAGSVKNCASFLDRDFIVISGDCICDFDLRAAIAFHREHEGPVTVVLTSVPDPSSYGVVLTDQNNRITRFLEKPEWDRVYSDTVNTGIYICDRALLDRIASDRSVDFARDVFPSLMQDRIPIYGYYADGYWCDVGTVESYADCQTAILQGGSALAWKSVNPSGATVTDPCCIAEGVVANGAQIGPFSVIGQDVEIGEGSRIERSVLMDRVKIGKNVTLHGAIVCNGAVLEDGVRAGEYSVIGAGSLIGQNAVIAAGSLIDPNTAIGANARVQGGVCSAKEPYWQENGEIRIQLSNENDISVFARLGAAFAAVVGGNFAIAYNSAELLPYFMALVSGLLSMQTSVFDLENTDDSYLRFATRNYSFSGGIYVMKEHGAVVIRFYEEDGLPLRRRLQRAVETAFRRPDRPIEKSGTYRSYTGFRTVYEKYLECFKSFQFSDTRVVGSSALYSILPIEKCVRQTFRIQDRTLTVADESRKIYHDDTVAVAVAVAYGRIYGKVAIPYDAPMLIDEIGKRQGFTVTRLTLDDADRRMLFDLSDPNIRALVLMSFLEQNGLTFAEYAEQLPSYAIRKREIRIPRNRAQVMRMLTELPSDRKELVEGIRFFHGSTSVLIVPSTHPEGFRICAEARNAEQAEELCGFYVEQLQKIEKET